MGRNATGIKRVKRDKPSNYNTGYHFNTECPKSTEIESNIHGKLRVSRDKKSGRVEKVSLISRGRD